MPAQKRPANRRGPNRPGPRPPVATPRPSPPAEAPAEAPDTSESASSTTRTAGAEADVKKQLRENVLAQAELRLSELETVLAAITEMRDQTTVALAKAVDALRSTALTYHREKDHKTPYPFCEEDRCVTSRELWARMGEAPGVTLAASDPSSYWEARTKEPSFLALKEQIRSPEDETVLEPPQTELAPEVDPATMGWGPEHASKRVARLNVPAPEDERDERDPGPLSNMRVDI